MSGINIKNATKINIGNSSIFNPENLRNSVVFFMYDEEIMANKAINNRKGGETHV